MKNKTSFAKIAFMVLLIVVIAGIIAFLLIERPKLHGKTGCPIEKGHTAVTLSIVLDATEIYGATQQRSIVNRVWDRVDSLDVYDRIKIYTVESTAQPPVFHLCKPGKELQDSPVHTLLKDVRFKKFLNDALEKLQGTQDESPIIASLGWVAADRERDDSSQYILLVSDLIENSGGFSQYKQDWQAVYQANRKLIHDQCPMLEGIQIDILWPARSDQSTQDDTLVFWWDEYLGTCGGYVNSITKITGVN